MPKIMKFRNYCVRVQSLRRHGTAPKEWVGREKAASLMMEAEKVRSQIYRHLDDVDASIAFDQQPFCGYCGAPWEELHGEPTCCDLAIGEHRTAVAKAAQLQERFLLKEAG